MMIKVRYILETRFPIVAPNSLGFLYPMIKLGIKKYWIDKWCSET